MPLTLMLVAFCLTLLETWVATKEGRADRQSTMARNARYSWIAGGWATSFEAVLLLDIGIVVTPVGLGNKIATGVACCLGALVGKVWACERRRRKFRTKGLNRGRRRYSNQRGEGQG